MNVIAIDPGGEHVGLCMLNMHKPLVAFECAPDTFYSMMHDNEASWWDHIIYEGFRIRALPALINSRVPTIEMIGAIKFWASGHRSLIEQLPAVKANWPDAELVKHLHLHNGKLPTSIHARDAMRHMAHFLARRQLWDLLT